MNTTDFTAINRGTGEIEIHKPGCKDLKRGARGASTWNITAATHEDVIRDCFADMIDSGESTVEECIEGVTYANCTRRPAAAAPVQTQVDADTTTVIPAPTSRKNSKQAEIILTFLAQHAGTAYTPHQISVAMGHKGLRDACARLAAQGVIIKASDKPVSYKIAA